MNLCCVCGKGLDGTDWLCHDCAKEHNLENKPFSDWPSWAKELVIFEQQERRSRNKELESGYQIKEYGTIEELEILESLGKDMVNVFDK